MGRSLGTRLDYTVVVNLHRLHYSDQFTLYFWEAHRLHYSGQFTLYLLPLFLRAGMLWCHHHTQGKMALSGVCDRGEEHTVLALPQQRGGIKKSEVSRKQNQ